MEKMIFQNLLKHIHLVKKHYDEIAQAKGENFNIFNVLGVSTKETKLHSALIAELISPDGSHGLNDTFLKLFLKELKINDFDTSTAKVDIEVNAGYIDNEHNEGGRIDILISNHASQCIAIENKIYAIDQTKQLVRYKHYLKSKYPNWHRLFYLTLSDTTPSNASAENLIVNEDYFLISYKETITALIEKSMKEAFDHSIVRETLKQYLILIKQLTNQFYNSAMENELNNIVISNLENFIAANECSKALDTAKQNIAEEFVNEVNKRIKEDSTQFVTIFTHTLQPSIINDSDGLQVAYSAVMNGSDVSSFDYKGTNELRKKLQSLKDFKFKGSPIFWKILKNYTFKQRIENMDIESIYKFHSHKDQLVSQIIEEIKEYNLLISRIQSN